LEAQALSSMAELHVLNDAKGQAEVAGQGLFGGSLKPAFLFVSDKFRGSAMVSQHWDFYQGEMPVLEFQSAGAFWSDEQLLAVEHLQEAGVRKQFDDFK